MKQFRFIPHPEDAVEVELEYGGKLNEIVVYVNDEGNEPFITQVNDRMTVEDGYLVLYEEFVRKPDRK